MSIILMKTKKKSKKLKNMLFHIYIANHKRNQKLLKFNKKKRKKKFKSQRIKTFDKKNIVNQIYKLTKILTEK